MCRKRQQIKMCPLYCHSRHLSISLSVRLSVCLCVLCLCQCLSALQKHTFHSSSAAKTRLEMSSSSSSFFISCDGCQPYADLLIMHGLFCLFCFVLPGHRVSELWLFGYRMVCNGAMLLYSTNTKANLQIHSTVQGQGQRRIWNLIGQRWWPPYQSEKVFIVGLLVLWMDYWTGIPLDQSPCMTKWLQINT